MVRPDSPKPVVSKAVYIIERNERIKSPRIKEYQRKERKMLKEKNRELFEKRQMQKKTQPQNRIKSPRTSRRGVAGDMHIRRFFLCIPPKTNQTSLISYQMAVYFQILEAVPHPRELPIPWFRLSKTLRNKFGRFDWGGQIWG